MPSCAQSTDGDERPCPRSNYGDIVPGALTRASLSQLIAGTAYDHVSRFERSEDLNQLAIRLAPAHIHPFRNAVANANRRRFARS